ncbi:Cys-tRNA(Pro)/Cys-tRNA(Cys) deacylase YbaK [Corynebacterium provencense]|uniref:Cys-tRNA(Pro)/Cys-tRNA(Cys) deacylase n=1 Tax=Corynebacterium provencense TaxID=1737425 RepID=A0A2Z3YXN8_9CORY|nr:Cys-tRNA(Pro) deacylase [Corynebacterium provencense]AWT27294.1 Cys-tRNA(Pro)/Cys-tRNA(Cys) deacylase YbaK [Corynebacterium provencense]
MSRKTKNPHQSHRNGATPAVTTLEKAGVEFTVRTFHHDPGVASYGHEAAAALDFPSQRICKTLLVELEGGSRGGHMGVVVVPVTAMLDLKSVASAFAAKKATMADPGAAERSTGYVVGGISPLGQKKRLPTVVDASVTQEPSILVSGGRRGFDVELAPGDLVSLLDATVADVGRPDPRH